MTEKLGNSVTPLILVVDDEIDIAHLLKTVLNSNKHQVITAYDGEDALEKTRANNPDLILLDAYLPKISGWDVCKTLKSDNRMRYTPIIMMTAKTDTKTKQKCYDYGADEFINKPFETVDLLARVKAMLRIKSMGDELIDLNTDLKQKIIEKTKELELLYMQTLKSLAKAIDAKDHYTRQHSSRVSQYAVLIAKELSLNEKEVNEIYEASEFHDLGKLSIPDNILRKQEKLTEEEWMHIKDHPQASVDILGPLIFLESTLEAIRQHHERYDGNGYPFGNKGEEIPLKARIIAIADSFEAMTSDRPYRKALSLEKAVDELEKNSGKQFDPGIVRIFVKMIEADKLEVNTNSEDWKENDTL